MIRLGAAAPGTGYTTKQAKTTMTIPLKRFQARAVHAVLMAASLASLLIVTLIFLFLIREALPFFQSPEKSTLLAKNWIPKSFQSATFGLLPLLGGSLLVTLLASLIAVPMGVCGAVYIAEVAGPRERDWLKPFVELLAGIPSVVIGFFGLMVVAPAVKSLFGLQSGLSALTGAIILALMAIPTIMSVSEDAIRSVPASLREASMALGATAQQTVWRAVVPAAMPGITAAVLLGFGRVIGETMAAMMVTGNAAQLTLSPVESVRTMTATIAAEMGEVAFGSTHYHALFLVGVVLLTTTFLINIAAVTVVKRMGAHR